MEKLMGWTDKKPASFSLDGGKTAEEKVKKITMVLCT